MWLIWKKRMNLEQIARNVIHIDVSYLFKNVKTKDEFYRLKDQLYYFLIERVVSYATYYNKTNHIAFTEKDKDELYTSIVNGYMDIKDILLTNYNFLTTEQVMGIVNFTTCELNYIDKFAHEVIKRLYKDKYVYFNLIIFSNGVISLSYFL
jgi:hypothetical protein